MSYLVLARKYRPTGFDEFVGQDVISETLRNAIRLDRVAHAYLFCGPRGVGKTSMARVFAKALNCVDGPTPEPCGRCERCESIATGEDVDVIEIDGASNRGIDAVRDIRQNARYAAARSRFKIYYIDEVHMLTQEAFNALLKTLEEPPAHVKFIFATTAPAKLPDTILSRIQRFDFRRIANADIVKKLGEICEAEDVKAPDDVLLLVARKARGSMRDALSLFDQVLSFCGDSPDIDAVASVLGALGDEELARLIAMVRSNDAAGLVRLADGLLVRGLDVGEILDQLVEYLRDLLVARVCGADPDLLDRPSESAAAVAETARALEPEHLMYMGPTLHQAKRRVREGQDDRLVLEMTLVKLAQSQGMLPMSQVLERLSALEDSLTGAGPSARPNPQDRPAPRPRSAAPANPAVRERPPTPRRATDYGDPPATPSRESAAPPSAGDLWAQTLERVHEKSLMLHTFLHGAQFGGVKDGVATIAFPGDRRSHHDEIESHTNRRLIESILSELHGSPLRIRLVNGTDGGAKGPPPPSAARDEIVQDALDVFHGQVVREDSGT